MITKLNPAKSRKNQAKKDIKIFDNTDACKDKEEILNNLTAQDFHKMKSFLNNLNSFFEITGALSEKNFASIINRSNKKVGDRYLTYEELPSFLKALEEEPSIITDFFLLLIHTAERKNIVLAMAWENIDWKNKQWNIPSIHQYERLRSVFLTDEAVEILYKRRRQSISPWVFPSPKSKTGHLVQPQSAWNRIVKKAKLKGLTMDDLRKTKEQLIASIRIS